MKKVFFVVLIVLLTIAGIGCAVDAPNPSATQSIATKEYVDQKDAAEAAARTLADTALTNADAGIVKRVDEIAGKVTTPVSSYTKTEVDAMLKIKQDSIDALTTKINQWTTGNLPTNPQSPFGSPQIPTSPQGQVTWVVNPATLTIFSGMQNVTAGNLWALSTPNTLCSFTVTPSGYVQPYTMRVTNSSSVIQYVKPVITISQPSQGGYYYGGGNYPQLTYFNVSIGSGLGQIQGTGMSHFYQKTGAVGSLGYYADVQGTTNFNGWYPSSYGTFVPGGSVNSLWILQNGWWLQSQTNQVYTIPAGQINGNFPFSISPPNANVQQTPSFTLTTSAPSLNGYGEYQLNPGQIIDMQISLQIGTLQQATLQIQTSVSYRQ